MFYKNKNLRAIILKKKKLISNDVVLSLLTQEFGKRTVLTKGVRSLKSKNKAFIDPGNLVKLHLIETKSLPLVTQIIGLDQLDVINLKIIKKLFLFLEILDVFFVEEEIDPYIFEKVLYIRKSILNNSKIDITKEFGTIIKYLGFPSLKQSGVSSIYEYVNKVMEKKLISFSFFEIK